MDMDAPAAAGELVPAVRPRLRDAVASHRSPRPRLTVRQFVEWYATNHAVEPSTVYQYRITAERFDDWAGGAVYLDELDELVVSAWLRDYAATVRPATVRSKRNQILALWRAAADEYLCEPPTRRVRTARVPWIAPTAWTLDEVRELLRAASSLPRWHACGMRRSEWFDLAIRLAWDTGLRWGDLVRLRAADVHGGVVVVGQAKTKRPHCGRLATSTQAALRASLERHPRDLVCPWIASRETFAAQVRRLVARAGIRPGTWKWLRRAGATDVECQSPGQGHGSRHLGHAPGSKIAELHYLDPAVVAATIEMVTPRDLERRPHHGP